MYKDDDAYTCEVWEHCLKQRGWKSKPASGLATWQFFPGNLLRSGLSMGDIRRLGTRGVHWCLDWEGLQAMLDRYGVDHAPDPTPEMLLLVPAHVCKISADATPVNVDGEGDDVAAASSAPSEDGPDTAGRDSVKTVEHEAAEGEDRSLSDYGDVSDDGGVPTAVFVTPERPERPVHALLQDLEANLMIEPSARSSRGRERLETIERKIFGRVNPTGESIFLRRVHICLDEVI